jgi:plasmid stability protein
MSVMIQVRNVPDGVHRTLKMRAAATGTSLSDYVKRELVRAAEQATLEEVDERLQARGSSGLRSETVLAALREVRDG